MGGLGEVLTASPRPNEVRRILQDNTSSCFKQVSAGLVEIVAPRRSDRMQVTKETASGQSQITLTPEVQRIIAKHHSHCEQQILAELTDGLTATSPRCGSVAEM